jgi:glycosyltransferase involved in cell wall biosynthesis
MENTKKITVMQLLPSLESGGVERGTIDIAKILKKENFKPIVASAGGVLVYDLRESGIAHVEIASLKRKNPISIILNINRIRKLIIEHNIDIIHARSRAVMWSAYFACKNSKTKLISTVHGTYSCDFLGIKNFLLKKFYNSVMLKADRIITVSNFIKSYLLQNYSGNFCNKISVIQRGVDLTYFDSQRVSKNRVIDLSKKWNLPEDKKIILMPARFTTWKGHEFLIDALTQVESDFFCVMVGSDHGHKQYRKKIEERIVQKKLESKVRVVDNCRDMPAAYAIAHFVVSPSIRPEAFGRISIEVQASNKIIVATKIGGALETISDGQTGFLVDIGDYTNFAKTIDMVLKLDKEVVDKISDAGRKNIEKNFSSKQMCDLTLDIYRQVLN